MLLKMEGWAHGLKSAQRETLFLFFAKIQKKFLHFLDENTKGAIYKMKAQYARQQTKKLSVCFKKKEEIPCICISVICILDIKGVIQFDHRSFQDVNEMDRTLIQLWNSRVRQEDHVHIVGDFACQNEREEQWYLRQLKGYKHLIVGNHDGRLLNNAPSANFGCPGCITASRRNALNVGACINNYTPASINELIRNNRIFQNGK